ncbi:MAG: type IV toxin-antitoxin system AbiEi family antitoxin domain-containing protein [Deltaproteobacteria bacterium]|nr:type IV toxin-antitoxin system AbiEi family antitoxin domain-containing protein [Deltaproteobacteria bacterium]
MRLIDAFSKLKELQSPLFTTGDAAACLRVTPAHASQILARLRKARQIIQLTRGKWAFNEPIDPLTIPEFLTAPWPSYISLQTALFFHEMIDQVPQIVYAVSLMRTKQYKTPMGLFSIHQVVPDFFFGFETIAGAGNIKMASSEKALVDVLYLSPAKSGLFRALPELEFPKNFSRKRAFQIAAEIPSPRRRKMVETQLKTLFAG